MGAGLEEEYHMTPSIRTLRQHWPLDTARKLRKVLDGTTDPESYDAVERWVRLCYGPPRRQELILAACDAILETHGTEAIHAEGAHVDSYHFDIVACYCNTGDSYAATILYDTARDRFVVTSWGDWVETAERTRRYSFN